MSDGFVAPDVSMPASADTGSVSPDSAPSASVQPEATQAAPEVAQAQPETVVAESAPAAPPELPDEQTFEQLTGPERGNNWKQARARIAELTGQVQQFTAYQPAIEQINQLGGWEAVQQYADLGRMLFSQIQGENGDIQLTAEPLLARLASEAPSTLEELVWKGIQQPDPRNPNQTLKDAIVSEMLGLNPALLDTYRQIQSPADARQYAQPGQVTAEELAAIPNEFHEAYKSLTPRQREEFQLVSDDQTKLDFLQDKADALQARQFIAQQKEAEAKQQQAYAQQFQERVGERSAQLSGQARDAAMANAKSKLQAEAVFSTNADVNDAIHNDAIQWAAQQCLADPSLAADNDRAEKLYELAADAELRGEKIKANQYRVQADALAKKLEGHFLNKLTKRTALWSSALGQARQAQQQQVEQARPRPELASNNQSTPRQNQATQTVGNGRGGFGWSPQQLAQMEATLKAAQMANG